MKYPRYIYVLSGDPLHNSHLNTKRTAEALFGEPVALVICKNESKKQPLFTLEERQQIAQKYLPREDIYIASTKEEIKSFIIHAEMVFRGYRGPTDIIDDQSKAAAYGVEDQFSKLFLIPVPERFKPVCSSRLKELVATRQEDKIKDWAPEWVIEMVRSKLVAQP